MVDKPEGAEKHLARARVAVARSDGVPKGEPPWEDERRVLSLREAVDDLPFPATRADIVDRVGGRAVQDREERRFQLAQVLSEVEQERFRDLRELEEAVARRWGDRFRT